VQVYQEAAHERQAPGAVDAGTCSAATDGDETTSCNAPVRICPNVADDLRIAAVTRRSCSRPDEVEAIPSAGALAGIAHGVTLRALAADPSGGRALITRCRSLPGHGGVTGRKPVVGAGSEGVSASGISTTFKVSLPCSAQGGPRARDIGKREDRSIERTARRAGKVTVTPLAPIGLSPRK